MDAGKEKRGKNSSQEFGSKKHLKVLNAATQAIHLLS